MRIVVATASAALLSALASPLAAQTPQPRLYDVKQSDNAPQVDLWLDQVDYHLGDRIAPHFVTEPGAYVTIVRINSDGQLRVLYPQRPRDQQRYRKAQLVNNRVPYYSGDSRFEIFESQGMGFVFAIASYDKFDFSYFSQGGEWSVARLANDGRYGDPFEIVRRFVDRTLSNSDYSMDYVSYDVYNSGARSRYASRYGYHTFDDYYDDCVSAFGFRYTSYCRSAYSDYYGPIVVSRPNTPNPSQPSGRNYAGKHIRPVTGDPIVDGPLELQPTTEGRFPANNTAEQAALAAHRDRLARQATPRDRSITNVDTRPIDNAPRIYASPVRAEPVERQPDRAPVMRAEPRVEQPRVEQQRAEPRAQPVAQPRVEVRNEPPAQPVQRSEPAPRPAAAPVEKDHEN
ncbi:MAG: DUF4384 domain-containing protein [Gemmatimonadaceae bacterium]